MEYLIAFIAAAVLLALVAWLVGRAIGRPRKEQPVEHARGKRLAVIESIAVDDYRRLMIVRRDQAEHLIMVGGPSDIVVEGNIGRAQPARRPQQPSAGPMPAGQQAASAPRPAPPPGQAGATPPRQPTHPAALTEQAAVTPPAAEPSAAAPTMPMEEAADSPVVQAGTGSPQVGAGVAAAGLAAGAAALAAAQAQKASTQNVPAGGGGPGFPAPINVKEILGIDESDSSETAPAPPAENSPLPSVPSAAPQPVAGSSATTAPAPGASAAGEEEASRSAFGKRGGPSPDRLKSAMTPTARQDADPQATNGAAPKPASPAPAEPAAAKAQPQPSSPGEAVNPFPNLANFDIEELQRSLEGIEAPSPPSPEEIVEDEAASEAKEQPQPVPAEKPETAASQVAEKAQTAAGSSAALSDLASRLEAALARQGDKADGDGKGGTVTPIAGSGRRQPGGAGDSIEGDSNAAPAGGQDSLEQEMARLLGELTSRKG